VIVIPVTPAMSEKTGAGMKRLAGARGQFRYRPKQLTTKKFSLNATVIARQTNGSAEERKMTDSLKKIVCCLILLALVGTVSAGYGTAATAGTGAPADPQVTGSSHGDRGLLGITGEPGTNIVVAGECYFPIYNLPAYYVCIMFCKIGGGGDTCAPTCEAMLTVCD
jgi:hypothetical protein